jgi:hypothetical protein
MRKPGGSPAGHGGVREKQNADALFTRFTPFVHDLTAVHPLFYPIL